MPVLHLLTGPKWVFRPAGATNYPDKGEISPLSGQKCGNTASKTIKFLHFGHKFAPQARLVSPIFTQFSAFVRVSR